MQFTKALHHTIGWKAINTILTFFINLLLVRIMGADGSGDFFYAITLLSFFTLVISWSMEAGITYYGAKNLDNIPFITLLIIPWLAVQALVSWLMLDLIPININKNLSLLYVISNLIIIYFSALYYAKKLFVSINFLVCIVNFFVLAALVWVFTNRNNEQQVFNNWLSVKNDSVPQVSVKVTNDGTHPQNIYLGSFVYFIGFTLQALVLSIAFFVRLKFKTIIPAYQPKLIRDIVFYSSIAFVSNILFFLVTRIDYYFVQRFCNEIALGNYVQVSKMGQLLVLFPSIIAGVIFPFSAGTNDKNYLEKLQSLCRLVGLLFIPVAFMIVLIGYWLFPWLFGNGFTMMYLTALLYLPGFYCLSLVTILAAHLAGRALLIKNLVATSIALLLVITGDLLFIKTGGIYAAAAVSSVAYFFCLIYLLRVYKKNWDCKSYTFIVPRKTDLQLVLKKFPLPAFLK